MIIVTGATGRLGRHVVSQLLEKVPAGQIVAAVRDPEKAADLAMQGVTVRHADYDKPASLPGAFKGAEKILLISASEVGKRFTEHANVIAAAKQAAPALFAYTSLLHAEHAKMALATEHQQTEQAIREAGLPFVYLRNGWYFENYTENLAPALEHGALVGSAGNGLIAAASRADYAAAAVAVLTGPIGEHRGKYHELAGDVPFTMAELAAEVSRHAGRSIEYKDLPYAAYRDMLASFGLPPAFAHALADADVGITRGELDDRSGTLRRLIGRPTTTLRDAVAAAFAK